MTAASIPFLCMFALAAILWMLPVVLNARLSILAATDGAVLGFFGGVLTNGRMLTTENWSRLGASVREHALQAAPARPRRGPLRVRQAARRATAASALILIVVLACSGLVPHNGSAQSEYLILGLAPLWLTVYRWVKFAYRYALHQFSRALWWTMVVRPEPTVTLRALGTAIDDSDLARTVGGALFGTGVIFVIVGGLIS